MSQSEKKQLLKQKLLEDEGEDILSSSEIVVAACGPRVSGGRPRLVARGST